MDPNTLTGFAGSIVPITISFSECLALQYLQIIGDVLFRESLSAFLLWRLRQIHYDRRDQWVSIILFTIKSVLTLPILALQRPNMVYNPKLRMEICDHYHSQLENSFGRESMVTLFLGPILGDIYIVEVAVPLKTFINISLSYVITVDAEIVKVIEGRNPSKDSSGGSAGPEKSFKSLQSPRTPRTPPKYKATQSSVSRDIPSPSFKLPSAEQTSQIDNNKLAVVSMKRLSFFEWAGFVVGKRFNKNTLGVSYEDETETTDADVEKGLDKRRDSNLSNASTSSNSTDDNHIPAQVVLMNEWTGDLDIEVNNFIETLNRIMSENTNEITRLEKFQSCSDDIELEQMVSLISTFLDEITVNIL
ncbi:1095_t:CDS:2 [Cetraspora pellucida]|uniref:1095_t:CDS:1 n=1 Tax=Cetraspora pellucida TaxID=1433469 RepID=A0A9N9ABQ8_9GLOM|nr:1095_t:CDS:2 [Cetraspora pellucida]